DDLDDLFAAEDADDVIDAGHLLQEGIAQPLGEAAGDDDGADLALALEVEHLADDAERLLPGGLDEAAGVDDDDLGAVGLGGQRVAGLGELSKHPLGVNEVLGTAETDEGETSFDGFTHAVVPLPGQCGERVERTLLPPSGTNRMSLSYTGRATRPSR